MSREQRLFKIANELLKLAVHDPGCLGQFKHMPCTCRLAPFVKELRQMETMKKFGPLISAERKAKKVKNRKAYNDRLQGGESSIGGKEESTSRSIDGADSEEMGRD